MAMATYAFKRAVSDTDTETATIETGFNTEELWENRSKIDMEDEERPEVIERSKSVGETPHAPVASNIPHIDGALENIEEGDELASYSTPKSPEK